MGKVIKKAVAKLVESTAAAVKSATEEDLFDPLPSQASASSITSYPKKKYVEIDGKRFRVFKHTLHKGVAGKEREIYFINNWVDGVSIRLNNPSVKQIQELQSLYTRNRGYNIMKFNNSYTLYKMRVLTEDEISNIEEED